MLPLLQSLLLLCTPLLPSPPSPLPSQVEVILDEVTARDLIPFCKRLGATGVFTYPIQVKTKTFFETMGGSAWAGRAPSARLRGELSRLPALCPAAAAAGHPALRRTSIVD